jgi:predicted dehydrogenase
LAPDNINAGDGAPLGVGLIGCGAVAELYYAPAMQVLVQAGLIRVVTLVDPDPLRLACLGAKFLEARREEELHDRSFAEVDLAIVASPPRWHEEHVSRLLGLGIPVLCEKPMAGTLDEARRMVEAARDTGRLLSLGLFRRFFATSAMIKQLIEGRSFGAPIAVEWSEGGPFNWPAASPSFFTKSASSGGVFADMGTHILDLLIWWFGEPESLDYMDDSMGGLEANALAHFRFGGDVQVSLRLSRDTEIPNGTRVKFERGSVWFRGASADSLVVETNSSDWVVNGRLYKKTEQGLGCFGEMAPGYQKSFVAQLENFVAAVKGEQTLMVKAEEALRAHEWIERGYATRRLMEMPWFTVGETASARRLAEGPASV